MLLDEATSALDTTSERIVQAALDAVGAEYASTTLVVAHRLSTLVKMNRIVVMERGKLVEEGTHSALANKEGGLFQAMLKAQAVDTSIETTATTTTADVIVADKLPEPARLTNEGVSNKYSHTRPAGSMANRRRTVRHSRGAHLQLVVHHRI